MWAAKDNGKDINWHDAKQHCEEYRGGGYSDWRMPTLDEMKGLYDEKQAGSLTKCDDDLKAYITPLIKLSCVWFWSLKTEKNGSRADFFDDYWVWTYPEDSYGKRVLPVRGRN